MDDWIDLCIGCQLCDTVCASGVNISELNLIAKAKYLDEKGRPFRDWLLTHTHLFGSMASFFSPIVNLFLRNSAVKWVLDTVLKIDQRRELPAISLPPSGNGSEGHRSQGQQKIAYFYGCFTNTNEVDVGKATVEVLEANGFEVTLPPQDAAAFPCSVTEISKGRVRWG